MNTNRTNRTIIVIVLISIIAALLSACSGNAAQDAVNLIVSANSDGTKLASAQSVKWSPRTQDCGISEGTLLMNAINGDLKAAVENVAELTISTDEWLNGKMSSFSCIKAAE